MVIRQVSSVNRWPGSLCSRATAVLPDCWIAGLPGYGGCCWVVAWLLGLLFCWVCTVAVIRHLYDAFMRRIAGLLGCLIACLLGCLLACLLACSLACLLACLLAC